MLYSLAFLLPHFLPARLRQDRTEATAARSLGLRFILHRVGARQHAGMQISRVSRQPYQYQAALTSTATTAPRLAAHARVERLYNIADPAERFRKILARRLIDTDSRKLRIILGKHFVCYSLSAESLETVQVIVNTSLSFEHTLRNTQVHTRIYSMYVNRSAAAMTV